MFNWEEQEPFSSCTGVPVSLPLITAEKRIRRNFRRKIASNYLLYEQ